MRIDLQIAQVGLCAAYTPVLHMYVILQSADLSAYDEEVIAQPVLSLPVPIQPDGQAAVAGAHERADRGDKDAGGGNRLGERHCLRHCLRHALSRHSGDEEVHQSLGDAAIQPKVYQ